MKASKLAWRGWLNQRPGRASHFGQRAPEAGLWWYLRIMIRTTWRWPTWFIPKYSSNYIHTLHRGWPPRSFKINNGRHRAIGHIHIRFDESVHFEVETEFDQNGGSIPCDVLGYVKHGGACFVSDLGLPVQAHPDIAGSLGGLACYSRWTQVLQSTESFNTQRSIPHLLWCFKFLTQPEQCANHCARRFIWGRITPSCSIRWW